MKMSFKMCLSVERRAPGNLFMCVISVVDLAARSFGVRSVCKMQQIPATPWHINSCVKLMEIPLAQKFIRLFIIYSEYDFAGRPRLMNFRCGRRVSGIEKF